MSARLLAIAVIVLSLGLARAVAVGDTAGEVQLRIDQTGVIGVSVAVNGEKPLTFLLDTGAGRSAIGAGIARRLKLPVVAKTFVDTLAGSEEHRVVRIEQLAIGSASAEALLAVVMSDAQLDAVGPGIDGIIGQDFLSKFNYTLDYRRKRLAWTAESIAGEPATRLRLIEASGRFLVELPADDSRSTAMRMVPDSGAESLVIFERNGKVPVKLGASAGATNLMSLNGQSVARTAMLEQLHVGDATLRHQRAVIYRKAQESSGEGDGLLPLHLFASVSFNSRERYLVARAR